MKLALLIWHYFTSPSAEKISIEYQLKKIHLEGHLNFLFRTYHSFSTVSSLKKQISRKKR